MIRPLNFFEKGYIAQQNSFFASCEMAARAKARYLVGLTQPPPGYAGFNFADVQAYAHQVLESGVGDQREFAKSFLQFHTFDINTDTVGINESINVTLLSQLWSAEDADFDAFMDEVFKLKG